MVAVPVLSVPIKDDREPKGPPKARRKYEACVMGPESRFRMMKCHAANIHQDATSPHVVRKSSHTESFNGK